MPFDVPPPPLDNPVYLNHRRWMLRALELAETAGAAGDVPVGAVMVGPGDEVIAEAANCREQTHDPTGHAEILVLRQAGQHLQNWHLNQCRMYVTLEPCPMCAGAIVNSRLGLLVYGADDLKTGAIRSVVNVPDGPASNHHLKVQGGILASSCQQQLQNWFRQRRH